ncbi:hypothetical protein ACYSNX_01070 [Myroides sp. LJL115]
MKKLKQISIAIFTALVLSSCAVQVKSNANHDIPPGQMKKITGSKSAKPYAPGQNKAKKHNKKHH